MSQATGKSIEPRKPARARPFVVGQWLAVPDLNQLQHRSDSLIRHLEPRLMQLLAFLAANPEQVLSRDELVQELWPRVIVNDNSLTRAVSELRKQLDTSELSGQQYIQTIPKRGYRLRLPVMDPARKQAGKLQDRPHSASDGDLQPRADLVAAWLPQTASRRAPTTLAAACLTLVLGAWLLNNPGADRDSTLSGPLADQLVSSELQPVSGEFQLSVAPAAALPVDSIDTPVISPDRRQYAFIAREPTGFAVYKGDLQSDSEPVRVYEHSAPLSHLAWSPLGNALLFAQHPAMTPAAIFSGQRDEATLLSLDLDSYQVSRLVAQPLPPRDATPEANLT